MAAVFVLAVTGDVFTNGGSTARADTPEAEEAEEAACGDVREIRKYASALVAIGPRPDSSPSARTAVELIAKRIAELGFEAEREVIGAVDLKGIEVGDRVIRHGGVAHSSSENIWVRIGGSGPARILLAHYDTVAQSPGAVDNAAAVGVLLELLRCWKQAPPPGPVIVAFPGGEEVGLLGAHRLAHRLAGEVELAVSLDLIGKQTHLALNGLGPDWELERLRWLRNRLEVSAASADAPLIHRLVSRTMPHLERSDHGAFAEAVIPSLHLYGRDDDRIFLAYHTPLDTIGQLNDAALSNVFALAAELATAHEPFPQAGTDMGVWLPLGPVGNIVVAHTWMLVFEILLAIGAVVLVLLCWLRRRRATRERAIGVIGVILIFAISMLVAAIASQVELIVHRNALSPFHEPIRFSASLLGLAAAFGGLLSIAVGRWAFFVRGTRYHLTAAVLCLAPGLFLLGLNLIEIAWLPLLAALLFALGGRLVERPIGCSIATALGIAVYSLPLLNPALLRESIFHGIYPEPLPFIGFLALAILPSWIATVGALRARLVSPGSRISPILAIALAAFGAVCATMLLAPEPVCSPALSEAFGLSCELTRP